MRQRNDQWPHWKLVEEIGIVTVYFSRLEIYMLGILKALGRPGNEWELFGSPEKIFKDLNSRIEKSDLSDDIKSILKGISQRFNEQREKRNDLTHSAWLHKSDQTDTKKYYRVSRGGDKSMKEMNMEELENLMYQIPKLFDSIERLFDSSDELPAWSDVDICPEGFESLRPYIVVNQ